MSEYPIYAPMVRNDNPETSIESAESVEQSLGAIQSAVMQAYREHGPMSARQAERLNELRGYAPSTVRKRVSELASAGRLIECGVERDSGKCASTVYNVVTK